MHNTTLDSSFVNRLKEILASRYGKSLQIRQLLDLSEVSFEKEVFTRGRDLHIPIRVNGAFLGTAVVPSADDLNEEKKVGVTQLVRMVLEPAMYKWYLEQREANLTELTKAQVSFENVSVFGDDPLPTIDEILEDMPLKQNLSPGMELISHMIHLEGSLDTTNKKVALHLHEMTQRWAFVPFNDIKGQLHSSFDIAKMGAMYPLVLSMLLGPRGAYLGYFVVLSTMTGFTYLNINGLGPNLIEQYGIPKLEKILNLVGFMVFASVTAHFYYHREKDVKANLVQKNNDVENLLRVLLHDIANTLSRMTYDLVRHKEGDGEPLEIDKIEKAMEDINTLLFQVRHLKSIKDGKSVLPMKGISLTMVLHEVYEIIESQAQQKGIKIAMDMAREKMWVQGDRTILSNVILLNLLTNAIKFSHPGAHIDVRAYLKDKNVVVEVQDYGIGIPPDILRDIFSLNVVTTRPGTHGESGTGYGMPLVKEYLQLMGGQIEVSSQEQEIATFKRGTLVTLLIPIARA
jgi:signal transduction histidine kinase